MEGEHRLHDFERKGRVLTTYCSLFQSHRRLTLGNLALRQQLAMLTSSVKCLQASVLGRLFQVLFAKYVNGWRAMLHTLQPDTVVRWHRLIPFLAIYCEIGMPSMEKLSHDGSRTWR